MGFASAQPIGLSAEFHQFSTVAPLAHQQLAQENNVPTASLYVVSLITLVTVVGIWATFKFDATLKKSRPSEWEQLGRPSLFSKKSIRQEIRLIGFVALRKYRKFQDPHLSRFGDLIFLCTSVNFLLCVIWSLLPHKPGFFVFG
jgi:hypothetical protein